LLLPFQMSVLNFTTPSVSSTNFLYNLVGCPGGIYKFIREQRMLWPLVLCIVIGTIPGVLLGYIIRIIYLPEPKRFKLFVGIVLLYIGYRLAKSFTKATVRKNSHKQPLRIKSVKTTLLRVDFWFMNKKHSFRTILVSGVSLIIGIIGGIYGIGGGLIISSFLISILDLPVYVIAGAVLMSTFSTSFFGLLFYSLIPLKGGITAPPDWALGALFGIGGLAGMYLGVKVQKYVPEHLIKAILAGIILLVAGRYILQFFS